MGREVQLIILSILFQLIGILVGQIIKVCEQVLVVPDGEKEPPIFKKENFANEYDFKYALVLMILYPFLYLKYGFTVDFVIYGLLAATLEAIFVIDLKHYIIPDKLNFFVIFLGIVKIVQLFCLGQSSLAVNHILAGLIGGGIFLTLAGIALLVYRQEGMGFGDIKLMCGLGLIFGIKNILVLTLIAFVLGAIVCIFLLVTRIKKMKEYVPFGPFICIASIVLLFIPASFFVDWYFNLLLR